MRIFSNKTARALRTAAFVTAAACAVFLFAACRGGGGDVAVLWTDRPEFAFYAKYFNASQDRYRIDVFHRDRPARGLGGPGPAPDIVAASWLLGSSARDFFRPLDAFLRGDDSIADAFYPRLLAMGNFDGRQYLLPVSFNAPLAVFAEGHAPPPGGLLGPLTIGLDEMRELGEGHNARTGAAFTRMGFSPEWDDGFLFVAATLFGASFREDVSPMESRPLAWDPPSLARAMDFVHDWTAQTNSGFRASDDFAFRFFNAPPASMALDGRIFFAYMDSSDFFTLAEDLRNKLGFRWIARRTGDRETVPLAECAAYLGLTRSGGSPRAADAFVRWFFRADTQRSLLERSHKFRQMETSFGIAGGFSALRQVTEQIFPQFYPDLLGQVPREDFFEPSGALPGDWADMRERVILPYLGERARRPDGEGLVPLETRLADWARLNRF